MIRSGNIDELENCITPRPRGPYAAGDLGAAFPFDRSADIVLALQVEPELHALLPK